MQQREQRASGDVLGDDGKLAGVIQTRPDKMNDTGVIESAEDGDLPAEHVHVRLGAVCVGSITATSKNSLVYVSAHMKRIIAVFRDGYRLMATILFLHLPL